jgi:hypothetical protein
MFKANIILRCTVLELEIFDGKIGNHVLGDPRITVSCITVVTQISLCP